MDFRLLKIIAFDIKKYGLLILCSFCIITLSMATVYISFSNRQNIGVWNQLLRQQDELNVEWHHLLLEEQTYSEHHRIREVATQHLNMLRPQPNEEKVISLP